VPISSRTLPMRQPDTAVHRQSLPPHRRGNVQVNLVVALFLSVAALLSACASPSTIDVQRTESPPRCIATDLQPVFITEADEASKVEIQASLGKVSAVLASGAFVQECSRSSMNRTGACSVAEVCQQLACAGAREIRIGIYADASMKTVAFEKNGAVFVNIAKRRGGVPGNLAHEFAHTLGYSHATYWSLMKKHSVPYVVGALVDHLAALGPVQTLVPANVASGHGPLQSEAAGCRNTSS